MKKIVVRILGVLGIVILSAAAAFGITMLIRNRNVAQTGNLLGVEWYNETDTEFTIQTVEQLYELADLSDFYDFKGQTIKLGADLVVNEGNAEDWKEKRPEKKWKPIDGFAGTFDGQGHTISGVCGIGLDTPMALFSNTKVSCVITDMKLVNSYFQTGGMEGTASFVSTGGGKLSKLYSDAIIDATEVCGGIVGKFTSASKMTECWYDGSITSINRDCGGLVSSVISCGVEIEHCLFTGTIDNTYQEDGSDISRIGGLVGYVDEIGTLKLTDILMAGRMNAVTTNSRTGAVVGRVDTGDSFTVSEVYVDKAAYPSMYGVITAFAALGQSITVDSDKLIGTTAYQWTNLDFDEYWTVVENDAPTLKCFAENDASVEGIRKAYDTSWYDATKKEFVLTTKEQFYGFYYLSLTNDFNGKIIKLGNDIVLNEGNAADWEENAPANSWNGIGTFSKPFAGTFDGQGHTISGVYMRVKETTTVYVGLFNHTAGSSKICNFRLTNSYIERMDSNYNNGLTGSVVGQASGTVDTVYSDAIVKSNNIRIGGMIGRVDGLAMKVNVSNCQFDGTVKLVSNNAKYAGGIVGVVQKGTLIMSHCLFSGVMDVEANTGGIHIGGLLGCEDAENTNVALTDCLSSGRIYTNKAYTCVGATVGRLRLAGNEYTFTNVYASNEVFLTGAGNALPIGSVPAATKIGGVTALSEATITGYGGYTWTELDFKNYWAVDLNGTPVLKSFASKTPSVAGQTRMVDTSWYTAEGKEFTINTAAEFYGFAYLSEYYTFENQTVKLGKDITLNAGNAADWAENPPAYLWRSIGESSEVSKFTTLFAGTFDGQGHTISGLYLKETATVEKYVGLFEITSHTSTVKKFRLVNSYVERTGAKSNSFVGSIAGDMRGTLDTVYSDAIVVSDKKIVGGLVARANGTKVDNVYQTATVNNCWFDGTIELSTANGMHAGGIAGVAVQGNVNFTNCLFTGKITSSYEKAVNVGGILGINWTKNAVVTVSDCLSAGELDINGVGKSSAVGSVIGGTSNSSIYTIAKTYGLAETATRGLGNRYKTTTVTGTATVKDNLDGVYGYAFTDLDFEKYWVVRDGDVPALKSFWNGSTIAITEDMLRADTSWYTDAKADKNGNEPGTEKNPYLIENVEDFYGLAILVNDYANTFKGKTVKLVNDIDITKVNVGWQENGTSTVAPTYVWTPIGHASTFAGTFDGNGKTISGVYVKNEDEADTYIGLFGIVAHEGVVKNFRLENSYFERIAATSGNAYVGSVAGDIKGTLDTVYSEAFVSSTGKMTGGLVGRVNGTPINGEYQTVTIHNCWFNGTVSLSTVNGTHAGGIAGVAVQGIINISNCLNTGTIISSYEKAINAGGIVGINWTKNATINISDCVGAGIFNINGVGGSSSVGTVVGGTSNTSTYTFERTYGDARSAARALGNQYSGTDVTGLPVNKDSLDGVLGYSFTELDFENTWAARNEDVPVLQCFWDGDSIAIDDNMMRLDKTWYTEALVDAYGNLPGSVENPYVIYDVSDFWGFAELVNEGITFYGQYVEVAEDVTILDLNPGWTENGAGTTAPTYVFTPIACNQATGGFCGIFDGNGVTIQGVYIDDSATVNHTGLFGRMYGTVQNFKLKNSYIIGQYAVGSIAGDLQGTISNVYSNAYVRATTGTTGGIAGRTRGGSINAKIENCWFAGQVYGAKTNVGGILGCAETSATVTISNSLNSGTVKSDYSNSSATTPIACVGGIVGRVNVPIAITNCFMTGDVQNTCTSGTATIVGRLYNAGQSCTISNVYTDVAANSVWSTANAITGMGQNSVNGKVITGEPVYRSDLNGLNGYIYTDLDFTNAWVAVDGSTPVLAQFKDEVSGTKLTASGQRVSTGWYYNAAYRNASTTNSTLVYEIDNTAELYGLAELVNGGTQSFSGMTVSMTASIDLNPNWAGSKASVTQPANVWESIGHRSGGNYTSDIAFAGTFNGNNKSIKGMYIKEGNANRVGIGLFGYVTGAVNNLRLENSFLQSSATVAGSIIGELRGNASGLYSDAYVWVDKAEVGGIVGRMHLNAAGTVSNCWFNGTVRTWSGDYLGGIVGNALIGPKVIENCWNSGTVIVGANSTQKAGGILGGSSNSSATTTIKNCLNTGRFEVKNITNKGSIVGQVRSGHTLRNNYYTTSKTSTGSLSGAVVLDINAIGSGTGTNVTEPVKATLPNDNSATLTGLNTGNTTTFWKILNNTIILSKFEDIVQSK